MFSRRGSGRDHGGGGVERDTAVSLSSAAHKRTVHTRNVCVPVCGSHMSVCVCVCKYMCSDSVVCVFPLQVVLSTCLCFWFCLLPVSRWFGGMHTEAAESGRTSSSCQLRFVFHSAPSCGLSFSISVSLFTFCLRHSPLRASTTLSFFTLVRETLSIFILMFPSIRSVSLPPPPFTPPISLLCHFFATSIPRAGTPEETATPKNSATTIMSTLSSHNNTRINLPSGFGGGGETTSSFGGSLSDLATLDGVSTLHRLVLVEV